MDSFNDMICLLFVLYLIKYHNYAEGGLWVDGEYIEDIKKPNTSVIEI